MSKIALLNLKGEKVKDITLNSKVWGIEVNDVALHDAIVLAQASLRQGTHSTKTRAEVSGGGRKPWRQKGTGNARQGSTRAPQWIKGGIVFGPKPRDYDKKQNKKERKLAMKSALTYKAKDNELVAIENLTLSAPKTKEMLEVIKNLKLESKVLFVVEELNENVVFATRNLNNVKVALYNNINVLDVVNSDNLVITEEAINKLEEVLLNE